MESSLEIIAIIGAVLVIVGRLMLWSVARYLNPAWIFVVRYLPLGDIVFLMRYWELARNGAITSLVGLILIMPQLASTLHSKSKANPESFANDESGDYMESAYLYPTRTVNRTNTIAFKAEKVDQLNEYLGRWYQLLQQRRQTVKEEGESALEQYNKDAAAYQQLLAVTKEETASLESLRATQ